MNYSITQQATRNLEERVSTLEGTSQSHEDRIKALEDMVKDALDRLRSVEQKQLLAGESSGSGVDVDALQNLLNNLRNEFDGKYFGKEAGERLSERTDGIDTRCTETEKRSYNNEREIDALKKALKNLESQLGNKVDCDMFDDEISALKQLINSMVPGEARSAPVAAHSGSGMNSKEMNKIREMIAKIPGIEEQLARVLKDLRGLDLNEIREQLKALQRDLEQKTDKSESARMGTDIVSLRDVTEKLRKDLDALKKSVGSSDQIKQINIRLEKVEIRCDLLERDVAELLKKAKQPTTMDFPQQPRNVGVDEESFR